jgi:predicted TIM-barrel fold metal-dependent hydrolase
VNRVIDAHVHLGVDHAHGFRQDRAQLLERMDQAGVDFALAAPFARADYMSETNEVLAVSLCHRVLGAGLIYPGSPDAVREIDRIIDDYGMRAALVDVEATFEYFLGHGLLSDQVRATFDRLADRSLPVLIHAHHPLQRFLTADLAVGIDALARRYPSLPLLVSTRVPALSLVLSHPTIYVESSLDTASPIDLEVLHQRVGPGRLLFASNAPVEHPLVKRMAFERIRCSAEDRSLMLGGGAARLLKLA